jgi:hypothetical protein
MGLVKVICDGSVWYNGEGHIKGGPPFRVDEESEKELLAAGLVESVKRPTVEPVVIEPPVVKEAPESQASPDPEPEPEAKPDPPKKPPKVKKTRVKAKKKVRKK